MGGGFGAIPLVLVLLLAVVVVVGVLVRGANRRKEAFDEAARDPDVETLRYRVPEGQDPVAVAAALQQRGFEATTDHGPGTYDVVVALPRTGGTTGGREEVRRVIAEDAPLNLESDKTSPRRVKFADEA